MERYILLIFSVLFLSCKAGKVDETENNLGINLPNGFKISVFADNVPNARGMAVGANGTLFVGSKGEGKVYAVVDTNGDFRADVVHTLVKNVKQPAGVAFKDGSLYYSAISKIYRLDNIEANLAEPPTPVLVTDAFPTDEHHGWKYIAFGPDGKLYVPVGAPCNICDEEDSIFSTITRINPDGSGLEIVAHGVRNTVGFDWHPTTGELWFTENGTDWMGDDIPPCELNRMAQVGQHYGFPYCHGNDIPHQDFTGGRNCNDYIKPVQNLDPHVAPLGMLFYTGNMFPAEYRNQVLIAEHGSWNRSTKIGYRVMMVKLNGNESAGYSDFATGWLDGDDVKGRPVDLIQWHDGSVLLSDDHAGMIYRISYE